MPGTLARAKLNPLVVAPRPGYEGQFSGSNTNRVSCKKALLLTAELGELFEDSSSSFPLAQPGFCKIGLPSLHAPPLPLPAYRCRVFFFLTSHLTGLLPFSPQPPRYFPTNRTAGLRMTPQQRPAQPRCPSRPDEGRRAGSRHLGP